MPEEKIEVIAYSGYRGEERPRAFIKNGERIEVIEILSQWMEESLENRRRKRVFFCKGIDGKVYKILYDEMKEEWYLKQPL